MCNQAVTSTLLLKNNFMTPQSDTKGSKIGSRLSLLKLTVRAGIDAGFFFAREGKWDAQTMHLPFLLGMWLSPKKCLKGSVWGGGGGGGNISITP